MVPKFEFFTDEANQHRWRLLAGNGEIVAVGESHERERDAVRAALQAAVLMQEAKEHFVGLI